MVSTVCTGTYGEQFLAEIGNYRYFSESTWYSQRHNPHSHFEACELVVRKRDTNEEVDRIYLKAEGARIVTFLMHKLDHLNSHVERLQFELNEVKRQLE